MAMCVFVHGCVCAGVGGLHVEHRTAGGREKPGSIWMRTGKVSAGSGTERGPCALRLAHCLPPGSAPKVLRVGRAIGGGKGPGTRAPRPRRLDSKSHLLAGWATLGKCLLPEAFSWYEIRMLQSLLEGCCGVNPGSGKAAVSLLLWTMVLLFITDEQIYLVLPMRLLNKSQPQSCSALGNSSSSTCHPES